MWILVFLWPFGDRAVVLIMEHFVSILLLSMQRRERHCPVQICRCPSHTCLSFIHVCQNRVCWVPLKKGKKKSGGSFCDSFHIYRETDTIRCNPESWPWANGWEIVSLPLEPEWGQTGAQADHSGLFDLMCCRCYFNTYTVTESIARVLVSLKNSVFLDSGRLVSVFPNK